MADPAGRVLAMPTSLIAVPGYYLAYGLLALFPGANPSDSAGSGTATADGATLSTASGSAATWFTLATHLLGILALTAAAILNVLAARTLAARRQAAIAGIPPAQPPGDPSE
jgi:hypothetical protein